MRAGDRNKYAGRNGRHEPHRTRIVLIVMGCFLMTMTFMFSTKPGNSNSDEAQGLPSPKKSDFQEVELQITQIREDSRSNKVEPQIEPPKEPINFGSVGVDLELPMDQKKEDSFQMENANTEDNRAEPTKIFGDVGNDEPKSDAGQIEPITEKIMFSDAGEKTELEKVVEEDSEQNINPQITLFGNTNLEEKTNDEPTELGNEVNKEQNSEDEKTEPAKIPTLLDHFNENQPEVKPISFQELGNGEEKENDNEKTETKEATNIPTLLDGFNEDPAKTQPKESWQTDSEKNGEQWIVTTPQKTEETTISNQFAASEKNDEQWIVTNARKAEETTSSNQFDIAKEIPSSNLQCDFTDFRSDTCNLEGDIRIHANSSTIYFVDPTDSSNQFYKLKPYPRKGDEMCFQRVQEFNVTSRKEAPQCSQSSDVPAILFSIGGYTGNIFHDFSDVIMPLFTASRPFNGKVQFLMTDTQTWWLIKYDKIIKALSHFEPIRLDVDEANNEVHCFKRVIVGLVAHRELIIEPLRNPNHYSTQDFTRFLRQIFPLEREAPTQLGEAAMNTKPKMLIISRARSRMITNLHQLVGLGQELGFEVLVQETDVGNDLIQFAQVINSCDVMIGVHGAGLTNEMFLPPNGTLIQIVPYGGLEWIGQMDYGDPAIAMGLNYIQYSIALEESSLLEKYGKDNEILKNPIEFHKRGFLFIHEFFMNGQNITLDLNKFRNVLITTLDKLTY